MEIQIQVITPAAVRASIRRAKAGLEKAAVEIVWQIEHEAWRTLGYSSWAAMREAEYGDAAFMVPSKQRPELVARLNRHLTQAEVAATAGVSHATVERDLASNPHLRDSDEPDTEPPTITNARGQQRPATYTTTPDAGPPPGEPVTITCPTCHGTGKVTQ